LVWILSWGYQELKGETILSGYSKQTNQGCPFRTRQDNIYGTSVGITVHFNDSLPSWCA
jgi:hypothetical protein